MREKTIIITERDGAYEIKNNGVADLTLIGILECILFEMKTTRRVNAPAPVQREDEERASSAEEKDADKPKEIAEMPENAPDVKPNQKSHEPTEGARESGTPNIRTRIDNAVKAIRNLGGEVSDIDRNDSTDEELQVELEELTVQYKRLKSSKKTG